jgi:hypothetical protein
MTPPNRWIWNLISAGSIQKEKKKERRSKNKMKRKQNHGANPTTSSYNASVVKTYSATNSKARF